MYESGKQSVLGSSRTSVPTSPDPENRISLSVAETLWSSGGARRSAGREEEPGGRRGTRPGTLFVPASYQENAVNDMFVLLSCTRKTAPAQRGFISIFIRSSIPKKDAFVWAASGKFTHCYLVTTHKSAATEPADVFHAFPSKDKCKFTLKREAIFSETHQRSVFLLLCLITVFTRVSR